MKDFHLFPVILVECYSIICGHICLVKCENIQRKHASILYISYFAFRKKFVNLVCWYLYLNHEIFVPQVFGALSQLDCSTEVWERILFQSFALLADSNDEPLEATMDFILKAALQCQHLPQAVCIEIFWNLNGTLSYSSLTSIIFHSLFHDI